MSNEDNTIEEMFSNFVKTIYEEGKKKGYNQAKKEDNAEVERLRTYIQKEDELRQQDSIELLKLKLKLKDEIRRFKKENKELMKYKIYVKHIYSHRKEFSHSEAPLDKWVLCKICGRSFGEIQKLKKDAETEFGEAILKEAEEKE
jgi:hypothetical protein